MMLAAGWTVTQSCDGTTADATDRWNAVSDINYAAAPAAHSWIVLRSPLDYPSAGNYIYFAIDYGAPTGDYRCDFAFRGDGDWTTLSTTVGPYDADTTIYYYNNKRNSLLLILIKLI